MHGDHGFYWWFACFGRHGRQRRWKTTIFAKLLCQKHLCFQEIGSKKAWKLLVKRVVFILSMISGTMAWSSTAPRIAEEALYITKTVEKVGLANIFHHFYLRASGSGRQPQRRMARLQISGHYAYPAVRSDVTPAPHFCPRATAAGSLH